MRPVLTVAALADGALEGLLERLGLGLHRVGEGEPIPGSYWGAPEAGLSSGPDGAVVWVRGDTPVHSALHEAGHAVCMDAERRRHLDTDAGGEDLEECGVCYLQLLLAEHLGGVGLERLASDMDTWGYSFRLGTTLEWFRKDAGDARTWLILEGLLSPGGELRWRLRGEGEPAAATVAASAS